MHPSSPPPLPPEKPLPKLMPFGSSGPWWWSAEIKQSFQCVCNGRKVAAMRQIYNLGIVAEVNFCYPLLGDHHKTPETFPVCFKYSFISDTTIHLFLKASFLSICSRGETKACQLKCLGFVFGVLGGGGGWGVVGFFLFHHLSPHSYRLNATSSFCLPISFSCRALLFQWGMLRFPTPNMHFAFLLPPCLAFCGNGSASASLLFPPLPCQGGSWSDGFLHCSSGRETSVK